MRWGAVRSILIVAAGVFATTAHAQTPAPAQIAKPAPPPAKEPAEKPPPIVFFVAKGEPLFPRIKA